MDDIEYMEANNLFQNNEDHDYRAMEQARMHEEFEELEKEQLKDWNILFKTHDEYTSALAKMSHPLHKEAMQIKANRIASGKFKPFKEMSYSSQPTLVEDIENQIRYNR